LSDTQSESRVMFSSFNPVSLWKVASYAPKIPRALLVSSDPSEDNRIYLRKMWTAPLLSIHTLNLDQALINDELLQIFKSNEVPVVAWTVNDQKQAHDLFKKGVSSIISDQIFE
jgi:glycerophosphoryl diester phosphodiesterase